MLLPHRVDVKLEGAGVGAHWLVVRERSRAQQAVVLHKLPQGGIMPTELAEGEKVEFDEPAYTLSGGETPPTPAPPRGLGLGVIRVLGFQHPFLTPEVGPNQRAYRHGMMYEAVPACKQQQLRW